jgi:hypothetical protein
MLILQSMQLKFLRAAFSRATLALVILGAQFMFEGSAFGQTTELRLLTPTANTGVVAAGPPVLAEGPIRLQGPIATVPLNYAKSGRLQNLVRSPVGRIEEGTILHAFRFETRSGQEEVNVWCGEGSRNPNRVQRVPDAMCIAFTRDGKARLVLPFQLYNVRATPETIYPHGLVTSSPGSNDAANVLERPVIEPLPQAASTLSYRIELTTITRESVLVTIKVLSPDKKEIPLGTATQRYLIPTMNGAGSFYLGETNIGIRVSGQTVTAERVDPTPLVATKPPAVSVSPPRAETQSTIEAEPLRPRKFVIQGLSMDPAALALATAPVATGRELATGHATWWQTGTTSGPIKGDAGGGNIDEPAGVRLYQVEYFEAGALLTRSRTLVWCGDVGKTIWGTRQDVPYCFRRFVDGLILTSQPMTDSFAADLRTDLGVKLLAAKDVTIIDDPAPVSPPFQMAIKLVTIARNKVTIDFIAKNGRQSVPLLRLDLPRTPNQDTLRLPLWTHVLDLRLAADGQSMTPSLRA